MLRRPVEPAVELGRRTAHSVLSTWPGARASACVRCIAGPRAGGMLGGIERQTTLVPLHDAAEHWSAEPPASPFAAHHGARVGWSGGPNLPIALARHLGRLSGPAEAVQRPRAMDWRGPATAAHTTPVGRGRGQRYSSSRAGMFARICLAVSASRMRTNWATSRRNRASASAAGPCDDGCRWAQGCRRAHRSPKRAKSVCSFPRGWVLPMVAGLSRLKTLSGGGQSPVRTRLCGPDSL